MKNRDFILLAALLIGVTGCAGEKLPPVSTYTLSPELNTFQLSKSSEAKPASILMLGRIRSTHLFNGRDIIYSDARYGQNSYAYSRWSDSPTTMLLLIFQEALEKSGRYVAVVPYSSQSESDFLLESTLFDFSHSINDDGTSSGIIRMRFSLIDKNTNRVIASRDFVATVPVALPMNASGAVAALNKAVIIVTQELIDWLK
ncbi:MAG: cholesterol transport system auxiliary component [Psychromonas sp.]|jgi:cholesterol transport system auxiliary component|uniref:ABC-type transport auxiliary lipoprotein family protein n=1 Tax=Psychromonas sp. TaxID=1884585 RepID=UPI0039E2146C